MVVVLYESCCGDYPYYTYKSLVINVPILEITSIDSLLMYVTPNEIEYVATVGSIVQPANAWQCQQGNLGPKYSITNIKIIPLQDFDSMHKSGEPANDLFQIRRYSEQTMQYETILLDDLEFLDNFLVEVFWTKQRPDNSSPIQFRIEITVSDGTQISVLSPSITWS